MTRVIEDSFTNPTMTSWEINRYGVPETGVEAVAGETVIYRKQWDTNPDFTTRRRTKKSLPPCSFFFRKTRILYPKGSMKYWADDNPGVTFSCKPYPNSTTPGQYMGFGITSEVEVDPVIRDAMFNRLAIDLLGKLKDQKVNLAQAFAERRQTADLLYTTAVRLSTSFRYLKRGDLYHAAEALGITATAGMFREYTRRYQRSPAKAAAGYWLELKYGWEPLLQDVYGSAQLIAQKQTRERPTRFYSSASELWQVINHMRGGLSNALVGEETITRQIKAKMSCNYVEDDPDAHTWAQSGIINPAVLAWELLPYSFVVDWFLPVGNYLQTLDATVGLKFVSGTFSYRYLMHNDHHAYGTSRGGMTYVGDLVGISRFEKACREKLISFPGATPPAFKNPFSAVHAFNAIALLTSVFGGTPGIQPRYR